MFGKKEPLPPTVYSEETCNSCGEKSRRPFEQGDYVFGAGPVCKKCHSSTMITAVYGEYPPEKR
jgi:hypothetical protein